MPSATPVSEGFVPFRGFRTWYRVVGDLAQPGPAEWVIFEHSSHEAHLEEDEYRRVVENFMRRVEGQV